MGLFADEIDTQVASQVYNLAGDQKERRDPLQQAVVSSVVTGNKDLAGTIQRTIVNGSGRRLKRYYRWARDQHPEFMPEAKIGGAYQIPKGAAQQGLNQELGTSPNVKNRVITAKVSQTDTRTFAGDWIIRNRPDLKANDWSSDYDAVSEVIQIDVQGKRETTIPAPADYKWVRADSDRRLLEVIYEKMARNPSTGATGKPQQKLLTYRLGSGNAHFDQIMRTEEEALSGFFPMLPMRLHNEFLPDMEHDDWPEVWDAAKAGYNRLTGGRAGDLIAQMDDNDDIGDVDHVFLVQGIGLNTENQSALAYLFAFFQELKGYQTTSPQEFKQWVRSTYKDTANQIAWERWTKLNTETPEEPEHETWKFWEKEQPKEEPEPIIGQSDQTWLKFENQVTDESHFEMSWVTIDERNGTGNAARYDGNQEREPVEAGNYWIHVGPEIELDNEDRRDQPNGGETGEYVQWRINNPSRTLNRIYIFHQYHPWRWRRLEIIGLTHHNYVYKDDEIRTKAGDAVNADGETPFIVPLHYPTLDRMGSRKIEELSTSASHLVFNSYERVRKEWYQQSWFRFVLTAAAIALALAPLAGAGLGASAGIFGTNAAVGTALGASAAAAAIVGAAVNTAGAFLLSAIIQGASVELLGEKWGRIVGAILTVVTVQMGRSFVDNGTFNMEWGSMMNIDNMMRLTNAVGGAYQDWLEYDTQQLMDEAEELTEEYEDTMDEIQAMTEEILGSTPDAIDPMILTDASEHFGESPETFLARTRMTGTDFAELTHAMIENFADLTLDLPNATS